MNLEKVAQLVKVAKQTKLEQQRKARRNYKMGGAQLRRTNKLKQRIKRRQGGFGMKQRVKIQTQRLKHKPIRIRKEPLQKRLRDRS